MLAFRRIPMILLLALLPFPASAQSLTHLEFDASEGTPTIDVQVQKKTLRFALDPLLGPYVTFNPRAARSLVLNPLKRGKFTAGIDDISVGGRMSLVELLADGRSKRVLVALLDRQHLPQVGNAYDLAGGFEALPADRITVRLNPEMPGEYRTIVFKRYGYDPTSGFPVTIRGIRMRVAFHFADPATWLDHRAAQALIDRGEGTPVGNVEPIPVWFGLKVPVQNLAIDMPIDANGLMIRELQARTSDPLIEPDERFREIIVPAFSRANRPPLMLVGTSSLRDCATMTYERTRRRLTLRCLAEH